MLHVLPQLAPPSGPCRERTTQATARGLDRTVDPLPTLGTDQNPGCVCSGGLFRPPSATVPLGERSPSPALGSCACPPS